MDKESISKIVFEWPDKDIILKKDFNPKDLGPEELLKLEASAESIYLSAAQQLSDFHADKLDFEISDKKLWYKNITFIKNQARHSLLMIRTQLYITRRKLKLFKNAFEIYFLECAKELLSRSEFVKIYNSAVERLKLRCETDEKPESYTELESSISPDKLALLPEELFNEESIS